LSYPFKKAIFSITDEQTFNNLAIELFLYQYANNLLYKQFTDSLGVVIQEVKTVSQIPFLPISFFKTHTVITGSNKPQIEFTSSATTSITSSRHILTDINLYEQSYLNGFNHFYGNPEEYCILALLPSYLEREGSSLIYMFNDLIKRSKHPESGFYLTELSSLAAKLTTLEARKQKTILLGVTYALLDLIAIKRFHLEHTIIMETGGMKGKRKEMIREELHALLKDAFGVSVIHSEYGMTELLSQAYADGNGIFTCPPWMQIRIRDVTDPLSYVRKGKTGGINVIDLANINSCSFIATQDLGKIVTDNTFELLGRFDASDVRGCNLLVQ
jgi:hypothetical protein